MPLLANLHAMATKRGDGLRPEFLNLLPEPEPVGQEGHVIAHLPADLTPFHADDGPVGSPSPPIGRK